MKKGNGVRYLHEPPEAEDDHYTQNLAVFIRNQSVSIILDRLNRMFDGIDDSFFELANNAHTNNEQNRYFESMREIRIKRKGIEKHLQTVITQAFDDPIEISQEQSNKTENETTSIDELSLVQNNALEEAVAIKSMITRVKADYAGSLMHFQTRYSAFLAGENSEKLYNPLNPETLCKSFGEACSVLDMEIKEKLIVFKQFDREVVDSLVDALDSGNKTLADAGILPRLKYTNHLVTKGKRSPPESKDSQHHVNERLPEKLLPGDNVLAQARELLSALKVPKAASAEAASTEKIVTDGKGPGPLRHASLRSNVGYSGPPVRIEAPELAGMLSNNLGSADSQDLSSGPVLSVDLRSSVQDLLNEQSRKTERPIEINQIDEDLIDLVAMLFDFILDDYNLTAPIQVLISRLQMPILKVAIKDKSFFSKPSHPARKLLNALAQASVGWSETIEKAKDNLYAKIHDIIREILANEACNPGFYESLYADFTEHLAREERRAKIIEKRTKEAEIGRIKSQQAQLVVNRILYEKISVTTLPQIALDLLQSGWSRVMFLVYLKEGRDHRFSQCVKVVDELIWCLQPHAEEEARKRWVQVVPKLLKNLKLGLREISYNENKLDEMLVSLKKELTQMFKQQSEQAYQLEKSSLDGLKASIESAEGKQAIITSDASLFEYLERIDTLQSGDWVEFFLVNGNRFRCKFSTSINGSDSLIFVNRMGLKVVEKSRMELAEELRKGQLIVLQSGLLMDRAIDAVMQNLRKMTDKVA